MAHGFPRCYCVADQHQSFPIPRLEFLLALVKLGLMLQGHNPSVSNERYCVGLASCVCICVYVCIVVILYSF